MSAPAQHPPIETRITDPSFLEGLNVVLEGYYARNAPQEEIEAVVKRAETFFLSTRADLDVEAPAPLASLTSVPPASSSSAPQPPPSSSSAAAPPAGDDPPYPPTFAQLAHLISTGAAIPGIRDIPDKLAEGEESEPRLAKTAGGKPWERVVQGQTAGVVGLEGQGAAEGTKERVEEEGTGQV
ncbi:hypothetical protein JCM6882_003900 [Rhodosporidiobolus microsporus]